MRKEFYCNPSTETKKAYLTRAARLLDIIRNHPEMVSSHAVLSGITPDEVKAFEAYLCDYIKDDVYMAATLAARKHSILDYEGIIQNNALATTLYLLHQYNSPTQVAYEGGLSFDKFLVNIIRSCVRDAFIEKLDTNKYRMDRVNRVRKTRVYVAITKHKDEDLVTPEEVFEAQVKVSKADPLSMESITEIMQHKSDIYYDAYDDDYYPKDLYNFRPDHDPFKEAEEEETRKSLHEMFSQLRKAERYVFLKRFLHGEDAMSYKQLAMDDKLLELCKEDEACRKHIDRGDLVIVRAKGCSCESGEVFTDIEYVNLDYLDYLYRSVVTKFRKFAEENELFPSDFRGWLNDWIHEELDNL